MALRAHERERCPSCSGLFGSCAVRENARKLRDLREPAAVLFKLGSMLRCMR